MIKEILEIFNDYTFQIVALGSALLGIISGVVGSFSVLRKQSLLGDGIAHAALPGVVIAFLITRQKDLEYLLLGALLTGVLATIIIKLIINNSKVKFDSALAMILAVFFGLGIVLLTYVQKIPDANQAGLDRFLFGQASTLLKRDVVIMAISSAIILIAVTVLWKELKVFSFDPVFAETVGFSNRTLDLILTALTVLGIIIGLQTVGVVLMSSLLIAPAVAARQWTDKLIHMVILSAFFGAISGVSGTLISSMNNNIPTGPTIILVASLIVIISILFAPNRGLLANYIRRKEAHKKLAKELD